MPAILIAAVLVVGVFYLLHRLSRPGGRMSKEAELRDQLRVKVMGNDGAVERLIDAERRRRPDASEVEHIRAAMRRLERDRR